MQKLKYLLELAFIGLFLIGLFSCSNEDSSSVNTMEGLEINVDFLKLVDNGTDVAGELFIASNAKDIQLIWNTDSICNLDTRLTTISSESGKYVLPIKWQKHLSDSTFAPEGVAYKAGVKIVAGEYSKYVPLIWAEKIDSIKIMESISPVTRSTNDALPRVAQITMVPTTVNLNSSNGGSMYVGLSEVPFVVFDLSEFTSDMNLDMELLPNYIEESKFLDFKWNSLGAPSYGFTANIIAMSQGLTQTGVVTYSPSTPPQPTQYTVNFSATTGGTVNPTSASGSLNQTVSSTANANAGYTFDGWYDGNTKVSSNVTYTVALTSATSGKTYQARFVVQAQNTLHFKILGKGTITNGANVIQETGGTLMLPGGMTTFTPNANYSVNAQFARWHKGSENGPQITATYGTEYVDGNGNLHVDPAVHGNTTYVAIFRNTGLVTNRIFVDTRMQMDRNSFAGNNTTIPVNGLSPSLELHSTVIGTPGTSGQNLYGLPVRYGCDNNTIFGYLHFTQAFDGDWAVARDNEVWGTTYGGRCDFWLFYFYFSRSPALGWWQVPEWAWTNDIFFYIVNRPGALNPSEVLAGIQNVLRQYGINP